MNWFCYLIEDAHPPIIDDATFNAVQEELATRRKVGLARSPGGYSALTLGKLSALSAGGITTGAPNETATARSTISGGAGLHPR